MAIASAIFLSQPVCQSTGRGSQIFSSHLMLGKQGYVCPVCGHITVLSSMPSTEFPKVLGWVNWSPGCSTNSDQAHLAK